MIELAICTTGERLAAAASVHWIGYPRAQAAIARLEWMLAHPPVLRPPNMLIVGPSNNGKSMIVERFRRMHPPGDSDNGDCEQIPVVIMQMPATPSPMRFYSALLSALGSPVNSHSSIDRRERLVLAIMRAAGVRLLIIDELHNMLSGQVNQQRQFLNMLRFLGNELRMSLACLGTKEAYFALRSDDQLENRFEPFPLPRWTNDADLGRLLASFEASLPLREPSRLSAPTMRALILRRSEGTIGEMAALLTAATRLALEQGREHIGPETIAAADYRAPSERRRQFESIIE